jgi:Uncharacterised ACR (DUF711)
MSVLPVIRSVCLFTREPDAAAVQRLNEIAERFAATGVTVQTRRILAPTLMKDFAPIAGNHDIYFSVGAVSADSMEAQASSFVAIDKMSCHLDLTDERPDARHTDLLFRLTRECPQKTFYFCYSFQAAPSSPYFPSATYAADGFSVGLQPTDLTSGCQDMDEWLARMSHAWDFVLELVGSEPDFLGIDSSVAPLGYDQGSLIAFVRRLHGSFRRSVLTDFYLRLTHFVKTANPRPVGLCGLMLPCLEDFPLAEEYENGNFDLSTNLFLSLHSGLGVDTYPLGIDENPAAVLDILHLVRGLSLKHRKPLSVRFVSDGTARIGERTQFRNPYLKDVVVRPLA